MSEQSRMLAVSCAKVHRQGWETPPTALFSGRHAAPGLVNLVLRGPGHLSPVGRRPKGLASMTAISTALCESKRREAACRRPSSARCEGIPTRFAVLGG